MGLWRHVHPEFAAMYARAREIDAEIDENLIRNELSALERAEHLARRKGFYEALHPTAPTGPGRPEKNGDTVSPFTANTAAATGLSERTIQRDIQIAAAIPAPIRDAIRDLPLADKKRELIELARVPEEEQRVVVGWVVGICGCLSDM